MKRIILHAHKKRSKALRKIPTRKIPKGLFLYRLNTSSASLYPHSHLKSLDKFLDKKHIFLALGLSPLMRHYDRHSLSQKDKATLSLHPNLSKNLSFILSRALLKSLKNIIKCAHFSSYSHKSDIALLAFARFPIGVDMEIIKSRDFKPHLDFCFSHFERDFVANSPNPLRYFYRIWTLKESLIKLENLRFSDLECVGLDKKGAFCESANKVSNDYKKNHRKNRVKDCKKQKNKNYHRFCFITRLYKYQKAIITLCY